MNHKAGVDLVDLVLRQILVNFERKTVNVNWPVFVVLARTFYDLITMTTVIGNMSKALTIDSNSSLMTVDRFQSY